MDLDKIAWVFKNDRTIKLLRADYASLIISFLGLIFKDYNHTASQKEIMDGLSDYLYSIDPEKQLYPLTPKQYIDKWVTDYYLRRTFEDSDEPIYELTPSTINAFKWLEELTKTGSMGMESRLLQLFNQLKNIVRKTTINIDDRLKDLEEQKQNIEKEIEEVKQGNLRLFDDREIRENFFIAEDTAKRLLYDFKQVEQNFREIDKDLRQKIIKSNLSKGKLLDDVFDQQDYLWTKDEGKSFKAFWDYLLSFKKQEELDNLIKKVLDLPVVSGMEEKKTIQRIKYNLIEAGEKVNRTNDSLLEQLRRFLEQKSLFESKRISHSIEEIERILIEDPQLLDSDFPLLELNSLIDLDFFIERPLFKPPIKLKFNTNDLIEAEDKSNDTKIVRQFYVDKERLRNNIKHFLNTKSQVTLSEIIAKYKIEQGASEVLAYFEIATKSNKHIINNNISEDIIISNKDTGKEYKINIPVVIFNR